MLYSRIDKNPIWNKKSPDSLYLIFGAKTPNHWERYTAYDKGGAMDFFKWKDSFRIGIEEIDQQHRVFLGYLNKYYLQIKGDKRDGMAPDMIKKLKAYADTHFRFEEDLIRLSGYPKVEYHERQHKYFEEQLAEFETSQAGGRGKTAESVLELLRDWFLNHILEQDKEFSPYVKY